MLFVPKRTASLWDGTQNRSLIVSHGDGSFKVQTMMCFGTSKHLCMYFALDDYIFSEPTGCTAELRRENL